ncbi:MAG: fructose-6-phosphate aldolase, partial [Synergistales bacterium]|nr:fructose-6-phosphate aldolase [Synergistales bacterium]
WDMAALFRIQNIKTQIIAASVRHPRHVYESALAGASICTIPFKVLELLFRHPLTDVGLERFLADWEGYERRHERNKG